ncbi:MAG: hypothetical protein IH969_03315 [Candidatus Krumholzibacteriota bacterium]|nr:hypothetical protein [Candidatus Krumholzibacteriota bacterium]
MSTKTFIRPDWIPEHIKLLGEPEDGLTEKKAAALPQPAEKKKPKRDGDA